MTPPDHRVVGIIGGMGPGATIELMRRVVAMTPARDDQDHIHLLVESNPKIPARIARLVERTGADPLPELLRIAQNLECAGANALAMPCNTAHYYADSIRSAVSIPFLDMVNLAVERIARLTPSARVGLLASTAVHNTGLYAKAFAAYALSPVKPHRQEDLMDLIRAVKRGQTGVQVRDYFAGITRELAEQSDILLVACTDLSLLTAGISAAVPLVDSIDVLTKAIVTFATAQGT